jgi:tetratricopeptide (TPR) repeat protein
VRYLAAFGKERVEKWQEALALYRGVPETSSLKPESEVRALVALRNLKRNDELVTESERVLAQSSPSAEVIGSISSVLADAERYKDAIHAVETGYEKFPDKPRLLFLKGVYQEKSGDREACIETMREVIKRDPSNSSAFNYLGYLFAERGENLEEAEKLVKRALELKPDDGFYLDSLGWVYYQKGELDKAVPALEKAVTIEPKEGVIFEHLGDVKLKQGDKKGALDLFKKALGGNVEPKDKARIEQKLRDASTGSATP